MRPEQTDDAVVGVKSSFHSLTLWPGFECYIVKFRFARYPHAIRGKLYDGASYVPQRGFGYLSDFGRPITALIRRFVHLRPDKACCWHVQHCGLVGYERGLVSHETVPIEWKDFLRPAAAALAC
jgi:hypothetical protein